jgi:hypothetical protein
MDIDKIKEWVVKNKIASILLLIVVLVILFVIYVISALNSGYSNDSMVSAPRSNINYGYEDSYREQSVKTSSSDSAGSVTESVDNRKIIKNGYLDLFVDDINQSISSIKSTANKFSGYIVSSSISESSVNIKNGQLTIKVPADQFELAMEEIKTFAKNVKSESITSSDVTDRYVDLEANLRNYKAEEAQYLEIMKRADTVDDILKVQQKLYEVRGKIEISESQLTRLSREVNMSSITVSLGSEPDAKILGITWKPLNTVRIEFREFVLDMKNLYESLIAFLFALPGLILKFAFWIALIVVIIKAIRFTYVKFLKTKNNANVIK